MGIDDRNIQVINERLNDWGGGDTTIPSPGRSQKQPLPGIGLRDPLYGRQACSKFYSCHQGVGQRIPREGLFPCRPLPKWGQNCDIPAPLQPLNDSNVEVIMENCRITIPTVHTYEYLVATMV